MEKVELGWGLRDTSAILNREFWSQDFAQMRESVIRHSAVRTLSRIVIGGRTWEKGVIPSWLKPEVPL